MLKLQLLLLLIKQIHDLRNLLAEEHEFCLEGEEGIEDHEPTGCGACDGVRRADSTIKQLLADLENAQIPRHRMLIQSRLPESAASMLCSLEAHLLEDREATIYTCIASQRAGGTRVFIQEHGAYELQIYGEASQEVLDKIRRMISSYAFIITSEATIAELSHA